MASELFDWDSIYRGDAPGFGGPPPWNIGEPQPELAALIDAGKINGTVLDAGCGHAELALALAARGHTVVGIDLSPTAIAAAQAAAAERGLSSATFVADDITTFSGYDEHFDTIVDSTLFHSLPVEARDPYQRAVLAAAKPGAAYYILVFAKGAFPPDAEQGPVPVEEDELREAVAKHWTVDAVRPAFIHANMAQLPDMPELPFDRDEHGRAKMPAFLLEAHKAG
jgi:SAM-dependent methyltransferase